MKTDKATVSLLDRTALLKGAPLRTEDVALTELGGTIRVRAFSGEDKAAWEDKVAQNSVHMMDGSGDRVQAKGLREYLVMLCAVNDDGTKLFTPSDLGAIGKLPWQVLQRLWDAASRLNALNEGAAAAEIAELKNDTGNAG